MSAEEHESVRDAAGGAGRASRSSRAGGPVSARRRDWAARLTVVFALALFGLGLFWDQLPAGDPRPDFLLGGVQVNEDSMERWVGRLSAVGMNAVSVTDYAHQGAWDSANLWFDGEVEGVLREIRAAEGAGLETVLILRVALDHAFPENEFLWHGMIQPETEEELAEWFRRYRSFARGWAEIAQEEGVDLLMVGSELNALTSTLPAEELPALQEWYLDEEKRREQRARLMSHAGEIQQRHLVQPGQGGYRDLGTYLDRRIGTERSWARRVGEDLEEINRRRALLERHWRDLIEELRGVYSGPLGYAANFDQYHEVGFWDALDVMGINAYFQLRRHLLPEAGREELLKILEQGWSEVLADIAELRRQQGLGDQPVVFTEMGYTYRAHSTVEPWASSGFSLLPVEPVAAAPGGSTAEPETRLVIWQEQPERLWERALAVRALRRVHARLEDPFLRGILWWKLSTRSWHWDEEPFLLLIDEDREDPLLAELRRFHELF